MDALPTDEDDGGISRWRAGLYISPFVAIGLADVLLLLWWGIDPLWGFMILPPILAISILGYIGFRHGFIRNIGEEGYEGDATDDGFDGEEGYDADQDAATVGE